MNDSPTLRRAGSPPQAIAVDDPLGFWSARPCLAAPAHLGARGRGLMALRDMAAGTLIERACTVEIGAEQSKPLDAMQPLGDFYFEHPQDPARGLMAFGLMSLINHDETANADVRWQWHADLGWLADLVAIRAIRAGDEITYRYKCPLWFDEQA
ncbi:MAG: SET domain-containing protein-lysine N-methyltransferase [Burkholderiaceae bacterium]